MVKLPSPTELRALLAHSLQEENQQRPLDSIEIVTVQAVLTRWGLQYPDDKPLPQTIEEWVHWAVRFSRNF